jgi:hypothetical protein
MSRYTNYSESELINEAIQVQNACNLSGVVRSFSAITERLWQLANENNKGTEWVNQHRVSRLFASKIQSLTGETQLHDFDPIVINTPESRSFTAN